MFLLLYPSLLQVESGYLAATNPYIYISLGSSCRVDSAILAEKLKLGSDGKFQGPRLIELSDFDREQNLESIFHS